MSCVVYQAIALYPPQHSHISLIHQLLVLPCHCPASSPVFHTWLIHVMLEFVGFFLLSYDSGYFFPLVPGSGFAICGLIHIHSASNIDLIYLKVVTFVLISFPPRLTLLSWQEDGGRHAISLLLTRSQLFSIFFLHSYSGSSACPRVFSHGHNAESWRMPTFTSKFSVDPSRAFTDDLQPSYISCITLMYSSSTLFVLSAHHLGTQSYAFPSWVWLCCWFMLSSLLLLFSVVHLTGCRMRDVRCRWTSRTIIVTSRFVAISGVLQVRMLSMFDQTIVYVIVCIFITNMLLHLENQLASSCGGLELRIIIMKRVQLSDVNR